MCNTCISPVYTCNGDEDGSTDGVVFSGGEGGETEQGWCCVQWWGWR